MFLFVILFGLDGLPRVHPEPRPRVHDRGLDTEHAVAKGIKSTAGVVTSAAVVMVLVFCVFALMPIVDMKEMGVGLAAAILIDATIGPGRAPARDDEAPGQVELVPADVVERLPSLEHERSHDPVPQPS